MIALRRIEGAQWHYLGYNRFGVTRRVRAHQLVARRRRAPPGITGHHVQHPADVPEYRVHTPETSPAEHGRLAALRQHWRGSPHDPRDPQRREPRRFHLTPP